MSTGIVLHLSIILLLNLSGTLAQRHLSVRGINLTINGEKVFLSGVNQPWVRMGYDFGNGGYNISRATLYKTLDAIQRSGGNSIRMWVHVTGESTPQFNSSGFVTGLDRYFLGDLSDFLQGAQDRNIIVDLCLWNGAVRPGSRLQGLIVDDMKLQSYIDNALIPIVNMLRNFRSLGSYDIMNEPEGLVDTGRFNSEPCYDTSIETGQWTYADWTGASLPLQSVLRFISLQANAIHLANPQALVTIGTWTYRTLTTRWFRTNFYSDRCLKLAGGNERGILDFYKMHTYDYLQRYLPRDPFRNNASTYELNKPLVIGEFSAKRGGGMTSPEQFSWAYSHGYSGSWPWSASGCNLFEVDCAADNLTVAETGMATLRTLNNQSLGGGVNISLRDIHL